MADDRDEFINRTQGWVGVITINRKGDELAGTVEPGGRVFLTAEEQTLTERVHRRREDSPFVPRLIRHFDLQTQDVIAEFTAPLLEKVEPAAAKRPRRRKPETAVVT